MDSSPVSELPPCRAGTFKKNAPGRKKALVKAAATSLVIVHELKIASRDAQCDGPALKKLASPIRGLLEPSAHSRR